MAVEGSAATGGAVPHIPLTTARALRRGVASDFFASLTKPGPARKAAEKAATTTQARTPDSAATQAPARTRQSARAYNPHTPVTSGGAVSPDRWDGMLGRIGKKYNVPPLFLKAVMLAESGGRPDAVGDSGHSVGLFQLHDRGYGAGMGDSRFDPEVNADRGARGLAEAWHVGEKKGLRGEHAIRAAYDYSFNPGGGWAYQGDAVVKYYNQLLAEQGQPPLT